MVEAKAGQGQPDFREPNLMELSARLNAKFADGCKAHDPEILQGLRSLPRPILVDMNNVLVGQYPFSANPEATSFMAELRKVGSVVIVTAEFRYPWDRIADFLRQQELLGEQDVLMMEMNWGFMEWPGDGTRLIQEYLEVAKTIGLEYKKEDFWPHWGARSYDSYPMEYRHSRKPVAPLFMRNHLIPIIDDNPLVTTGNPGLLGICVEVWDDDDFMQRRLSWEAQDRVPLTEAIGTVRDHYASLVAQ